MMVQAPEEVGEISSDAQDTSILTQPSSSKPQRKHKTRRKQRKETEVPQDEQPTEEHILTPSHDRVPSGEDRLQLNELMEICTKLSDIVLSLEQTKTNQAAKIEKLRKRMKKVWVIRRMHPNRGSIADINQDEGTTLDATAVEKDISTANPVTTASEVVTVAEDVEVAAAVTIPQISKDELTLAKTLMEIKEPKPKAKGVTIQEPKPEKPLKMKYQIAFDEEVARKLEAEMQPKMEEDERIAKEKEEANITMIAEWDNT
nr:hypothetical protein [Tanacetum cinerariifolium]